MPPYGLSLYFNNFPGTYFPGSLCVALIASPHRQTPGYQNVQLLAIKLLDKPWFSYSYTGAAGTRTRPSRFEYEYHFIEYEYDRPRISATSVARRGTQKLPSAYAGG